jgi:hypothetical protein
MSFTQQAEEAFARKVEQACPPTWDHDAWHLFVTLCRTWWPEPETNWTKDRLLGLAMGMADFTAEQAGDALKRLRDSGQKFPPRVPEIANAIHTDRSTPSWAEAYTLLFGRPDGVVHARVPRDARPADENERRELHETAMLQRAAQLHPMIGAFVAAFGARRLDGVQIDDEKYGALERERLREQWLEFVERADARRREGAPLLTAPLARRGLGAGGPRRLDAVAQLGLRTSLAGEGSAPELGSGECPAGGSQRGSHASSPAEVAFTSASRPRRMGPAAS